jgi:electron transfer flavoprotein alpha subunit
MENEIIVIAEHAKGQINPVTYELVGFAKKLQASVSLNIRVIILGADILKPATEIAHYSGLAVMAFDIPQLHDYNGELYCRVLAEHLTAAPPAYVCIAQTSQGLDFGPALAVELDSSCISGIEDLLPAEDDVCFARPLFSGKAVAHIRADTATAILIVQPGVFKPSRQTAAKSGRVALKPITIEPEWWHALGLKHLDPDTAGISEADVVVGVGQGFGDREKLELAHRLAAIFPKSAVAGSRIVCDLGWLKYGCQVGVTGKTVSPRLYIACGISGAIQHVSGMRGSELIVAINKDPAAAIFQVADICIVEDVLTFIPTLIDVYQNKPPAAGEN